MEETKKSSKGLIILIIILIICVIGLGGYIVYDKVLSKNKQITSTNNNTSSTTVENIKTINKQKYTIENNEIEINFVRKNNVNSITYAEVKINNKKAGEYIVENYSSISDNNDKDINESIYNNIKIDSINIDNKTYFIIIYHDDEEGCCSDENIIILDNDTNKIYKINMQRNPSYWNFEDEDMNNKFKQNEEMNTYYIEDNEIYFYENITDIIDGKKSEIDIYKLNINNNKAEKILIGKYKLKF